MLPAARVHHSRFADFQRDPLAVVSGLYAHFGIAWTPEAEAAMKRTREENPADRHGGHAYARSLLGEDPDASRPEFARYQAHFAVGSEAWRASVA